MGVVGLLVNVLSANLMLADETHSACLADHLNDGKLQVYKRTCKYSKIFLRMFKHNLDAVSCIVWI